MIFDIDRATGIGGSDVPAILGVSPYRTRLDVWLEKVRHPAWRPKPVSPEMEWGTRLEPVLRAAYEEETGRRVTSPGGKTYWSDDGIRYAHVDGLIVPDGLWEGKVPFQTWRNWADGPPVYVLAQVQHYLDIVDEPWCDVSALASGLDPIFRTWRVDSDPVAQADIREALKRFWFTNVGENIEPDPLPLAIRYPSHTSDLMLVADDDAEDTVAALFDLKARGATDDELEEEWKAQLREKIGTAAGMVGNGWRIRHKKNRDSEKVAWQQVAAVLRGQLEQVARLGPEEVQDLLAAQPDYDTVVSLYTTVTPGARPFVLEHWEPKEER